MSDTDQNASERKPSLSEVLERAKQPSELHTMIPAVVVRYAGGRKVDVKALVRRVYLNEEYERVAVSVAVVASVPVSWPGAGGYVYTCPISDGQTTTIDGAIPPATTGMLIVAERSIDKWLAGAGGEVDPEIDHHHHLTDGIFLPELRSFGKAYPATPADHSVIGYDGGVQLHMRKTVMCIGDEVGAAFIARADKVLSELQAIAAAFDPVTGHQHSFAAGAVGPPAGGTMYGPAGAVAADQGKVH